MRGGKLKELAASAVGKAVSPSDSAGTTVESLSSLFLSTLKKGSPDSTRRKHGGLRVDELILTKKKAVVSARLGSRPPGSSGSQDTEKPSKSPVNVSSQALSVLRKDGSGKLQEAPAKGDKSAMDVVLQITSALQGESGLLKVPQSEETKNSLTNSSIYDTHNIFKSHMQKERSRERKAKWTSKNTQDIRFSQLIKRSAQALGAESTIEVLGKLGKDTGIKEYNALISLCIDKARQSDAEDDSLAQLQKAFQLLKSMKEQGYQIEEESYHSLLMYLIDMEMIEEFNIISEMIKDENPQSNCRVCYYEMLLWIRTGNEEKIQNVCNSLGTDNSDRSFSIAENYLMAFCESDRKKELLDLLEVLDVRRISTPEYVSVIFKSLGKLSLEDLAMKFILALKSADARKEDISSLIFDCISNIPNLAVEEVVSRFIGLHERLKVAPSSQSYDRLIIFCCNSFKVYATLNPLLREMEQNFELYWVCNLISMVRRHSLKLDKESSKSIISLYVMVKDFEGAYNLLAELKEMDLGVDVSMYNAIMIGYFREKNISGGLMVLKQMKCANIKPDSETFSYLISNCDCEEDIVKCLEEMRLFRVDFTKNIYIALVNAYVNCGKFDQAKQVIMDKQVPVEHINEIKSTLIYALSSNGKVSDALEIYDAMKQAGCKVETKALASLIEFSQSEGQLNRLLKILSELDNSYLWFDACGRVAVYCVRNSLLSSAVDLLKQMKAKDELGTYTVIDQMFSEIWEADPANIEIGMALLQAIKSDLCLHPSRTSLDFLLSTCVKMEDLKSAWSIWAEYSKAGLPFNVLTYLRMYQARLASRDLRGAEKISRKIPVEDQHVCDIVKACKLAYGKSLSRSGNCV